MPETFADDLNDGWHGWGVSDKSVPSLHIGRLPLRRSVCLYTEGAGVIDTLAFFSSEAKAKQALAILDRLMEAERG